MSLRHRLQAWGELWHRYASVFFFYWKRRKQMKTDFFNKQEAEFLPAGLSLQETPDSKTLRNTARVLMAIVIFLLLWSIIGQVDIVVNATGKVIPSKRTKTIGSVETARVEALYVSEGQQVYAGDILIELNTSDSDVEYAKATDAVAQAKLQAARSSALIRAIEQRSPPQLKKVAEVTIAQRKAAQLQLEGQYQDFHAKLMLLDAEIAHYEAVLPLATQQADDLQALVADRSVSRHAWLEKEQTKMDLQARLSNAKNQRTALIAQTRKEAYDAIVEANKIIEAGQQEQYRASQHSKLMKLTSPIDGTVQQLTVHTVGGVVPAAQALMQIVPKENALEVEAFLENKDVGFVHAGQKANVKIDAFEYTKYGTIDARVKHVSQDAIQDKERGLIYATQITLQENTIFVNGKNIMLSPGMSVTAEIKTGERRIIEYVLSPLLRHGRESLRER